MLLENHKLYLDEALKGVAFNDEEKKEIRLGVIANDLCEFTEEGGMFFSCKSVLKQKKNIIADNSALYQSHFGNLASLHAMKSESNQSKDDSLSELTSWFDFFNLIATDNLPQNFEPHAKVNKVVSPIQHLFSDLKIEFNDIFDTNDLEKIKLRAVGMMVHLIQDSFTKSHCNRGENKEIVDFYFYGNQDSKQHKADDDVAKENKLFMIKACNDCLLALHNKELYDYRKVIF